MTTIPTVPISEGVEDSRSDTASTDASLEAASVLALTEAVCAGDRSAYERLFRTGCRFVEAETRRRLRRRRDLIQDAVQEAWVRVARSPRRCESASKLQAWLGRVVASAACDLLRSDVSRRLREECVARGRSEVVEFVADVELLEEIARDLRALESLAGDERALLELKARTGASLTRLAAIVGLGRSAVDSKLRRAAAIARASLEEGPSDGDAGAGGTHHA